MDCKYIYNQHWSWNLSHCILGLFSGACLQCDSTLVFGRELYLMCHCSSVFVFYLSDFRKRLQGSSTRWLCCTSSTSTTGRSTRSGKRFSWLWLAKIFLKLPLHSNLMVEITVRSEWQCSNSHQTHTDEHLHTLNFFFLAFLLFSGFLPNVVV